MATDEQMRLWVKQGRQMQRSHVLVVQDSPGNYFPSFVRYGDNLQAAIDRLNGKPHTQVVRTIPI